MSYANANGRALSVETIRKNAPSVFTDHAAPGMSAKYNQVNTGLILEELREIGYLPVAASQSRAISEFGQTFAKHVVRVMHEDYITKDHRMVGDIVPQIILTNGHNGATAFGMSAGLFRLICSNGMAVQSAQLANVRVLHNNPNIHQYIIDGTNLIREVTEKTILPQIETMTKLEMSKDQEWAFARAASVLRYGQVQHDEMVQAMLGVRRAEDDGRTIWQVLNRLQENAIKGGYVTTNANGRQVSARGITSATRDLDFNQKLWDLGARITEAIAA
jgi:ribosomal protein S19E (S16A)